MTTEETYVCDANCLINLYRYLGRVSLTVVRKLGRRDALKLPEGVARELMRGTDNLAKFIKKHGQSFVFRVSDNARLREQIARLERAYGGTIHFGQHSCDGFWKSPAGKKAADATSGCCSKKT